MRRSKSVKLKARNFDPRDDMQQYAIHALAKTPLSSGNKQDSFKNYDML